MDRTMKLFFFFCFAVFFFTGCSKGDTKGQVNGPKDSAASNKNSAAAKTIDAPVAKEIAKTFQILRDASGIYNEMLPLITNSEGVEQSKDIFKLLRDRLASEYKLDGQLKDKPAKASTCKIGTSHLNSEIKTVGTSKFILHQMYFNLCDGPKPTQAIARWHFDDQGMLQLEFNVSELIKDSSAVFGYGALGLMTQQGVQSGCTIGFSDADKFVTGFLCKNISQDIKGSNEVQATKSIYFELIDFNRSREKPLKTKGFLLDQGIKSKIIAEDDPGLNKFKVELYPEPEENSTDANALKTSAPELKAEPEAVKPEPNQPTEPVTAAPSEETKDKLELKAAQPEAPNAPAEPQNQLNQQQDPQGQQGNEPRTQPENEPKTQPEVEATPPPPEARVSRN